MDKQRRLSVEIQANLRRNSSSSRQHEAQRSDTNVRAIHKELERHRRKSFVSTTEAGQERHQVFLAASRLDFEAVLDRSKIWMKKTPEESYQNCDVDSNGCYIPDKTIKSDDEASNSEEVLHHFRSDLYNYMQRIVNSDSRHDEKGNRKQNSRSCKINQNRQKTTKVSIKSTLRASVPPVVSFYDIPQEIELILNSKRHTSGNQRQSSGTLLGRQRLQQTSVRGRLSNDAILKANSLVQLLSTAAKKERYKVQTS